jgi:hypothetical protein
MFQKSTYPAGLYMLRVINQTFKKCISQKSAKLLLNNSIYSDTLREEVIQ